MKVLTFEQATNAISNYNESESKKPEPKYVSATAGLYSKLLQVSREAILKDRKISRAARYFRREQKAAYSLKPFLNHKYDRAEKTVILQNILSFA